MKKNIILFFIIIPFGLFSQIQIGNDIDGEASDDSSGWATSISSDGSIVAIGAYRNDGNSMFPFYDSGHVRVFKNIENTWTQIGNDIDGDKPGSAFGYKISLSDDGNILAVGAYRNDYQKGAVYVYQNINNEWIQIGGRIDGEDSEDSFGRSLSLSADGNILAVGAFQGYKETGDDPGYVKVYKLNNNEWEQVGNNIKGEADGDWSGYGISLSDDGYTVAIGAYKNHGVNGEESGHVRVFKNTNDSWSQIGDDIDGEAGDNFSGIVVDLSVDGSIVAIGAMNNDGVNGEGSGHVRVYKNTNNSWTQIGSDIDGEAEHDWSGYDISLSDNGSIIAIGSRFNGGSGHVRIYQNINNNWNQIGNDIDGEEIADGSGHGLSLSGDGTTVAIGASGNDGNGEDSGHVRVYDLSKIIEKDDLFTDKISKSKTSFYLNYFSQELVINVNNNSILETCLIYNIKGKIVKEAKEPIIDISGLSSGLYFIKIITNNSKTFKKFIVK